MHPIIYQLGPFTVYSYGLMFATAVMVGTWLLSRDAARHGIKPDVVFDLIFWVVLIGILGARIYFVILYPEPFLENPLEFFMLQKGGLAFQGGFITGTIAALGYLKKKKLPLLLMLDLMAPYLALAHAIGRVGCLLNGCCYGKEVPWGLYFPVHEARLHPTQMYDIVGLLIVFFILRKIQQAPYVLGTIFAWYLILAGIERFINEFFRADHAAMYGGLSNFQVMSLGVLVAGVVMMVTLQAKVK